MKSVLLHGNCGYLPVVVCGIWCVRVRVCSA